MNRQNAEILALRALGWLVGDEDALQRFLDLSGLEGGALRAGAGSPEMNAAVLDFLLGQEDLLLRFCDTVAISPRDMHLAQHLMDGR